MAQILPFPNSLQGPPPPPTFGNAGNPQGMDFPVDDFIEGPPDPETEQQLYDDIMEHLPGLLTESADKVNQMRPAIEHYEKLYLNTYSLYELEDEYLSRAGTTRQGKADASSIKEEDSYRSQYVHPISDLIDQSVSYLYNSMFSGPDWAAIETAPGIEPLPGAQEIEMCLAIKQELVHALKAGKAHNQFHDLFSGQAKYGTCCGYSHLYEKYTTQWGRNALTGEPESRSTPILQYPLIQNIDLNIWLPDFSIFQTPDVDRWRFIGFRQFKSFREIEQLYKRGHYNIGQDEFYKRFNPDSGTAIDESWEYSNAGDDPNRPGETTGKKQKKLKVPYVAYLAETRYGMFECRLSLISEPGESTFENSMLARVEPGTGTFNNKRPFVVGQQGPMRGPYGYGICQRADRTVFAISQTHAQTQDITRRAARGGLVTNSSELRDAIESGGLQKEVLLIEDNADINRVMAPVPTVNLNELQMLMQYEGNQEAHLRALIGINIEAPDRATATTMNQLATQAQAPASSILQRTIAGVVEPMFNFSLGHLADIMGDPKIVQVKVQGNVKPVTINPDELRAGKYIAVCPITEPDSASQVKATNVTNLLDRLIAMETQGVLAKYGLQANLPDLLQQAINIIGINGPQQILQPGDPVATLSALVQQLGPDQVMAAFEQAMMQMQLPEGQEGNPGQMPANPPGSGGGDNDSMMRKEMQMNAAKGVEPYNA